MQKQSKVGDIVPQLLEKKGLPSSMAVKLFEVSLVSLMLLLTLYWDDTYLNSSTIDSIQEIKPTMIEPMKMKSTFNQCEIQGGDIVVFQKDLTPKEYVTVINQSADLGTKIETDRSRAMCFYLLE